MGAPELVEHALADLFPRMSDDEYQALKADIAANGMREPITLCDGRILDGRHRYRACNELGIKPQTREFPKDDSAVAYVVSMNLHRRNLTSSQRAAIAIEAGEFEKAEAEAKERRKRKPNSETQRIAEQNGGESAEQVAKIFGTNKQYVKDAKAISEVSREWYDDIRNGRKTIPQVKREVLKARRENDPSPSEEARNDPGVRWAASLRKIHVLLNSTRDNGGIDHLTREWTPELIKQYRDDVSDFIEELETWKKALTAKLRRR